MISKESEVQKRRTPAALDRNQIWLTAFSALRFFKGNCCYHLLGAKFSEFIRFLTSFPTTISCTATCTALSPLLQMFQSSFKILGILQISGDFSGFLVDLSGLCEVSSDLFFVLFLRVRCHSYLVGILILLPQSVQSRQFIKQRIR